MTPALGRRREARRLAVEHLDRLAVLSSVVGTSPEESAQLARLGFAMALRGERPFDGALVSAFGLLAAQQPDPDVAHHRLLVLLVEVEQRPVAEVARLLRLEPARVSHLLRREQRDANRPYAGRACRGWGLVARASGLTEAEQHGRAGHLALCRHCRLRLAARDRTRTQLLGGSIAVAGLLSATPLSTGGTLFATSAGGVLSGKAAVFAVGAASAAVLAAGGTSAAVLHPNQPPPAPERPSVQRIMPATHDPTGSPVCAAGCAPVRPQPTVTAAHQEPTSPTHTAVPTPAASLPAPPLPRPLLPGLPVPVPSLPRLPVAVPSLPTVDLPLVR